MDCDIDWCLTCEQRVNGSSPYCSLECQNHAGPSQAPIYNSLQQSLSNNHNNDDDDEDVIFHPIEAAQRWMGSDAAGILAWASEIPSGPPPGADSPTSTSSSSFQSTSYRPPPPNLIKPSRRVLPPSLSMATPLSPAMPASSPVMLSPKRHQSTTSITQSGYASMGQTSLVSTQDSSLATPVSSHPVPIGSRKHSILDGMYSHVRSWVSPSPAAQLSAAATNLQLLPPQTILPTKRTPTTTTKFLPVTIMSSPHLSPGFPDQSSVCWMARTVLLEQPTTTAKLPIHTSSTARGRRPAPNTPFRGREDHPSFRTRGRKASRAAA